MHWIWVLARNKNSSWRKLSRFLRRGNFSFNQVKKQRATSWYSLKITSHLFSKSYGVPSSHHSVKPCWSKITLKQWTSSSQDSKAVYAFSVNSAWSQNVKHSYSNSAVWLVSSHPINSSVKRTYKLSKQSCRSQCSIETISDTLGRFSSIVWVS